MKSEGCRGQPRRGTQKNRCEVACHNLLAARSGGMCALRLRRLGARGGRCGLCGWRGCGAAGDGGGEFVGALVCVGGDWLLRG